jgi:hypothetical protein
MDGLLQPTFPMLDGWKNFVYPLAFCNVINLILSFLLIPVLSYSDSQDGIFHIWLSVLASSVITAFIRNFLADTCYYYVYLINGNTDEFYNRIVTRFIVTGQSSVFLQTAREEREKSEVDEDVNERNSSSPNHSPSPSPSPSASPPPPPSSPIIKSALTKKNKQSKRHKKAVHMVEIKKHTDSGLPRCRFFLDNGHQCPFQCKPGVKHRCRIHSESKK